MNKWQGLCLERGHYHIWFGGQYINLVWETTWPLWRILQKWYWENVKQTGYEGSPSPTRSSVSDTVQERRSDCCGTAELLCCCLTNWSLIAPPLPSPFLLSNIERVVCRKAKRPYILQPLFAGNLVRNLLWTAAHHASSACGCTTQSRLFRHWIPGWLHFAEFCTLSSVFWLCTWTWSLTVSRILAQQITRSGQSVSN